MYSERKKSKKKNNTKIGWLVVVVGCDSDEIQCGGRCVRSYRICDGISDCPNREDERNCCMYKFFFWKYHLSICRLSITQGLPCILTTATFMY